MREALKNALKEIMLSFTPSRSQLEAMIRIDYKLGDVRSALMQLSFSRLAAWPLFVILIILYFDPSKNLWSLQSVLNNQDVAFWLLDGRLTNVSIVFGLFFILEWIFRKEYLFIGILTYFLLKSDLHLHLAFAGIFSVLLARGCYLWWFHIDLKSRTRKIWKSVMSLELLGWLLGVIASLFIYESMRLSGYFSASITENRFGFIFLSLVLTFAIQFVLTSFWGHFYFKTKFDPSDFPISYSTATWFLRFRMRPYFRKILREQTNKYRELHQKNLDELKSIKDLSPVSIPFKITELLQIELGYLKEASSRLTIE